MTPIVNWILVPIDFSEDSKLALETADDQADRWNSGLILLHVKKPTETPPTRMTIEENALARWVSRIKHIPRNRIALITCAGNPAEEILRIAEQYQPRKIIMGRGGDASSAGSVAQEVGWKFSGTVEVLSAKHDDVFIHARVA